MVQSSTAMFMLGNVFSTISLATDAELYMALNLDGSVMQRMPSALWLAFWKASRYSSGEELAVVGGLEALRSLA